MRCEEAAVDVVEADEGDRRAVVQRDGGVAVAIRDGAADDVGDRVGRAVQRYAVAARLAERGDRIVAACCRAIVPECFVVAGKADQRRSPRYALHGIVSAAPGRRVAAAGEDRLVT